MSTTHVAGTVIVNSDRFVRQRCAWCGEVLVDVDTTQVAIPTELLPKPLLEMETIDWAPTWPVTHQVRHDGAMWSLVEGERFPDDSCMAVDPAVTA